MKILIRIPGQGSDYEIENVSSDDKWRYIRGVLTLDTILSDKIFKTFFFQILVSSLEVVFKEGRLLKVHPR